MKKQKEKKKICIGPTTLNWLSDMPFFSLYPHIFFNFIQNISYFRCNMQDIYAYIFKMYSSIS